MSLLDILIGRPLANWEEHGEQVGPSAGIPIFGLDALSSAAYGPEAALTLLVPLGLFGLHYILPVVAAIVMLLIIVYFSYRQTIEAYPQGGGSYTVASANLATSATCCAFEIPKPTATGMPAGSEYRRMRSTSEAASAARLCCWPVMPTREMA